MGFVDILRLSTEALTSQHTSDSRKVLTGYSGRHTQLTLRKIDIWMSKNCPKIYVSFNGQKLSFFNDNFWQIFLKKMSSIGQILTHLMETGLLTRAAPRQYVNIFSYWLDNNDSKHDTCELTRLLIHIKNKETYQWLSKHYINIIINAYTSVRLNCCTSI